MVFRRDPHCLERGHYNSYSETEQGSLFCFELPALTNCLCKVFEKMINRQLPHFLESNKLLDPYQCGFIECRSTTDHLIHIETQICESFVHKQFFCLYSLLWKRLMIPHDGLEYLKTSHAWVYIVIC